MLYSCSKTLRIVKQIRKCKTVKYFYIFGRTNTAFTTIHFECLLAKNKLRDKLPYMIYPSYVLGREREGGGTPLRHFENVVCYEI